MHALPDPTSLVLASGTSDPDGRPGTDAPLDPTRDTYGDLNLAFRVFNERLFQARLSPTLITLRASGRTYGYFCAERFIDTRTGRRVHEIAFNPETFAQRGVEDVLSTLVHEMCHQQQHEDRTASRRAYHNRDFELKMRAVGLVPSATGQPGGPSVGEKMTHYIDRDGPFLRVATELLDSDFRIRWADRFLTQAMPRAVIATAVPGGLARRRTSAPVEAAPAHPTQPSLTAAPQASKALSGAVVSVARPTTPAARSKSKHTCPGCAAAAWGKPTLQLVCGRCSVPFVVQGG